MERLLETGDVFKTKQLKGKYVVTKTSFCGGGTGHGPHDVYPDGHLITARKLKGKEWDDKGMTVKFYQSGCFSGMIYPEKIELVGKMAQKWVMIST